MFDFVRKSVAFVGVLKSIYVNGISYPSRYRWDGESTPEQLGEPYDTDYNYYDLRNRGWGSYLKHHQTTNVLDKKDYWMIGKGLLLSLTPDLTVLADHGVNMTKDEANEWSKLVERKWRIFSESTDCSYDRGMNMHEIATQVLRDVSYGGDEAIVCRYDRSRGVTFEVIDGGTICTPNGGISGKNIINGIEINDSNEMVAFHVKTGAGKYVRVQSRNGNGQLQAWLIYSKRGRTKDIRGLSPMCNLFELTDSTDDYRNSIVTNAVQNSNVWAVTEHGTNSDGSNKVANKGPLRNVDAPQDVLAGDSPADIARKIKRTTNSTHINLAPDQKLARYDGKGFNADTAAFGDALTDQLYSAHGFAPEIAKDKFTSTYASARAVVKTTEHAIEVQRERILIRQLYSRCFKYWFEIMVMTGDIKAGNYLLLKDEAKAAYITHSFRGPTMPHVDPVKETRAVRDQLGPEYANYPLVKYDQACEKFAGIDGESVLQDSNKYLNDPDNEIYKKDEPETQLGAV